MEHADRYPALGRATTVLQPFVDLINDLTAKVDTMSLPDLFDEVMEKSGYLPTLRLAGEAEIDRIENIAALKSNIVEYVNNQEELGEIPTLPGFLEEYALVADVDKYDTEADAVVLMTIHSAKGLEFPIVFLPGMEDGIFPGIQNILGASEDMEEERRLAYVAITRAKRQIFISHAKTRIWYGQTVANPLSRFVGEIPDELIRREDMTAPSLYGSMGASYGTGASGYDTAPRRATRPAVTDRITVGKAANAPAAGVREAVNALSPGDRVLHSGFGEGEILSIKPMGADKLIEVMFDTVGTKKLMGTYAKLKKL